MKNSKFKIFSSAPHSAPFPYASEQKKRGCPTYFGQPPFRLKLYNKRDFNPAIAFFRHR